MKTMLRGIFGVLIWLASASAALANFVTFQVQWSGEPFGNSARATGFITFDNALLPLSSQTEIFLPDIAVANLGITITGATSGNGTFGLSHFGSIVFQSPSTLDLSTELIGQSLANGCTFGDSTGPCDDGEAGDFNLFGSGGGTPWGVWYFVLATSGESGIPEEMLVTSMRPLPEPTTLALLGLGLAGLAATRRRRQ